jgi:hypothetical protein
MVMREDDPRAAVRKCIGDDRLQREVRAVSVAGMMREVDTARLVVGVRDPQLLASRVAVGKAASEEGAGGGDCSSLRQLGYL